MAAIRALLAEGTYHYDLVVNGASIGKSDVAVSSDAHEMTVRERLTQGQVDAATQATYATPTVALTSYSADVKLPSGSQHTTVLVKHGVMTVQVPRQSVDINADPAAPLMIVGDNLVGTNVMIPSLLQATGAKTYTLAVLAGGKAYLAKVINEKVTSRPAGVPAGDSEVAVDVAGLREVFWYHPGSLVVDDVNVAAQGLDIRLVSQGAETPTPQQSAAPTPVPTCTALPESRCQFCFGRRNKTCGNNHRSGQGRAPLPGRGAGAWKRRGRSR